MRDDANDLLARLESGDLSASGDAAARPRAGRGRFDVTATPLPTGVPIPDAPPLPAPAADRAFFRSHRLVGAAGGDRLDVVAPDGTVVRRFPLRGGTPGGATPDWFGPFPGAVRVAVRVENLFDRRDDRGGRAATAAVGGVVVAVTGGAAAAVHPESGAALWSRGVAGSGGMRGTGSAFGVPSSGSTGPAELRRAGDLTRSLRSSVRARDGVGAVTCETTLIRDGRTLTAVDTLTGATVWVRRRLPPDAAVFGTATTALATASRGGAGLALHARDGSALPDPAEAVRLASKAAATAGAAIVSLEPTSGIFKLLGAERVVLKAWDPAADRLLWSRVLAPETRLAVLPEAAGAPRAVLVRREGKEGDGRVELLDLRTGETTPLGGADGGGFEHSVAVDAERVYLLSRPSPGAGRRVRPSRLDADAVGGPVEAFARTGGRLWRVDLGGSSLIEDGFARLPFAAFIVPDNAAPRGAVRNTEFIAVDKRTGREALRTVVPTLSDFEEGRARADGSALELWNDEPDPGEPWVARRTQPERWRLAVQPQVGGGE